MGPARKPAARRSYSATRNRILQSLWSKQDARDRYMAGEEAFIGAAKGLPIEKLLGVPLFFSTVIPLLFGYAGGSSRLDMHALLVAFVTIYLILPLVYLVLRGHGVSLWARLALLFGLALVAAAAPSFYRTGRWWGSFAWVLAFAALLLGAVSWLGANRTSRRRSAPRSQAANPLFWLAVLSVTGTGLLWLWPGDVFDRGRETFATSSVIQASGELVDLARSAQERDYTRVLLVQGGYVPAALDSGVQLRLLAERGRLAGELLDGMTGYLRRIDPDASRRESGVASVRAHAARDSLLARDSAAWIGRRIAGLAVLSDSAAGILAGAGQVKLLLVGQAADSLASGRRDAFLAEEAGYRAKREVIFSQVQEVHRLRVAFAQERLEQLVLDVRYKGRAIFGLALLLILGGYYHEVRRRRSRDPARRSTYVLGVAVIVVLAVPLFRPVDTSKLDPAHPLQSFILSSWYLPSAITPQALFGGGEASASRDAGGPGGQEGVAARRLAGGPADTTGRGTGEVLGTSTDTSRLPQPGTVVPPSEDTVLTPRDRILIRTVVAEMSRASREQWRPLKDGVDDLSRQLIGVRQAAGPAGTPAPGAPLSPDRP